MEGKSERFLAYYRVSTDRQGRSGLGLDAQRQAVQQHLASVGGALIGERVEVHILVAVSEHEREMIAARTRAALQAAKARGVRLGRNGAERLAPVNKAAAIERARESMPILSDLTATGMSAGQIAVESAKRHIATPRGGRWHPTTIGRILDRLTARARAS